MTSDDEPSPRSEQSKISTEMSPHLPAPQNSKDTSFTSDDFAEPCCFKFGQWIQFLRRTITIEPVMFLYFVSLSFIEKADFAYHTFRICTVEFGRPSYICYDLNHPEFDNLRNATRKMVLTLFEIRNIILTIVPIFISILFGSWSDRFGRKVPILIALFGHIMYCALMIFFTQISWRPYWISFFLLYIPIIFTGTHTVLQSMAICYITDNTPVRKRTIRIVLLEACGLTAKIVGNLLYTYFFESLTIIHFIIIYGYSFLLVVVAFLYALFCLRTRTLPSHQPLREASAFNVFYFEYFVMMWEAMKRRCREYHRRRAALWLLMCAVILSNISGRDSLLFQADIQYSWHLTVDNVVHFQLLQSCVGLFIVWIIVPVLSKVFHIQDSVLILCGIINIIVSHIIFLTSHTPVIVSIGIVCSASGLIISPLLRSILSKIITSEDRGRVIMCFTLLENMMICSSEFIYKAGDLLANPIFHNVALILSISIRCIMLFVILAIRSMMQKFDPLPVTIAVEESKIYRYNVGTTEYTPIRFDKPGDITYTPIQFEKPEESVLDDVI